MPLPILVGIGIGIATTLGGGALILSAKDRVKNAKEQYERRFKKHKQTEGRFKRRRKKADKKFDALGERRLQALITLGRAVDFLKKAKIRDRDLEQRLNITPQRLAEWEGASINAAEVLGGLTGSGVAGVSTAAGVYGLVGTLGTASTGTAIGTLSGAAAKSATLAWLGGGSLAVGGGGAAAGSMILGGIVVGPAVLVTGFFANSKAEKVETEVTEKIAQMDVAEVQIKQQLSMLKLVLSRVDELHEATDEVDQALEKQLATGSPENLENAYQVAQTAKSLGELLDISLVDKNGNITLD